MTWTLHIYNDGRPCAVSESAYGLTRWVAFCPTPEAAEAARRLLSGECVAAKEPEPLPPNMPHQCAGTTECARCERDRLLRNGGSAASGQYHSVEAAILIDDGDVDGVIAWALMLAEYRKQLLDSESTRGPGWLQKKADDDFGRMRREAMDMMRCNDCPGVADSAFVAGKGAGYAAGVADGAAQERARIVRWLQDEHPHLADRIERGDAGE